MQIRKLFQRLPLGLALAAIPLGLQAQTAIWTGPASGGEWNTAADWSTLLPPGSDVNATTNAIILAGTNVSYNLPMSAANFGALTNNGVLNINTNGFNCANIYLTIPTGGDRLFMTNSGTVVTIFNTLTMSTNSYAVLGNGASLTVGSLLVDFGGTSHAAGTSIFTNNGGYLTANTTTINNNTGTGTGLLLINGGTNNLGNTAVGRNAAGAGGATLGTEGLVINGGLVNMTNLNLGNNGNGASSLSAYVTGGVVTNYGSVFINQATSARFSRFLQTGGLFVVPDPGVVNPNPTVSGSLNNYTVFGGTNIVGGFFFGNSNGSPGTVDFTNGATIYVGSQGINSNGAVVLNALLNGGALFGATAPWTGSAAMKLVSGTFTFKTAGLDNTPNGIILSNVLSGAGALNVTGGGTLTFDATNTYAGNTLVSGGTLAVGGTGGLASPQIILGSGTTFDVSGTGGFPLNGNQTIAGFGTVNGPVIAASTATVFPGSNAVTGTLTFTGGLTEAGGVNNEFYMSSSATGPNNDFINASGGLNLAGTNTITIVGSLSTAPYPLINYGSSLTGDITNLVVSGPTGVFSNSAVAHTIYFIAQSSIRGPTNIVWVGNAAANWDTLTTTNWLNAGKLDYFVANDNVLFNNLGATNPVVNLPGTVMPGSVTVNTTSNYTFTGPGAIGGTAMLTVSNGTLTVLTTNTYTGATVFSGGILATPVLANSGNASGIGAATADPANVVFNGGTFSYIGASASTDHGMSITNLGATFDVTNGTTLTLNGNIIGNGNLTKVDNGTLVLNTGNSYTGNTVVSGGTLSLANVSAAGSGSVILNGGTLAIGAVKPANTIIVTNNSEITGGNAGGLTGVAKITGSSNLLLAVTVGSGVFDLTGDMSTYSGTITCSNAGGGTVRLNGSTTSDGSALATWDLGAGPMDLNIRVSCPSNNIGALQGSSGTTLSGRGGSANTGATTFYIGANGLSTTFDGTIHDGSNAGSTTSINKVGSGTLSLSGNSSPYTGTTTISSGTLALVYNPTNGNNGSFPDSATINVVAGAILDVSGTSDSMLHVGDNGAQTLEGRGTVLGSLEVSSSGVVAPGGGVGGNTGTLTVTNAITLSGTTWMKVNSGSTPTSDQLVSSLSTITYGGTLVVTNIGSLTVGQTFTLFSGAGLNASGFNSVILPNYYTFDTSKLGVNGTITLTNAFRPAFSAIDFSALSNGSITLNVTNGAASGPITVLTSTNLTGPWVTNSTTTFDGNGNLNTDTITVDPTQPQLFIKLQVQ